MIYKNYLQHFFKKRVYYTVTKVHKIFFGTILICFFHSTFAQNLVTDELLCAEKHKFASHANRRNNSNIYYGYNINYNKCFWRINPNRNGYLKGAVFHLFQVTNDADSIGFDLINYMQVDSIKRGNTHLRFTHKNNIIYCFKNNKWKKNILDSCTIFYQGPASNAGGLGYFTHDFHKTGAMVYTLSEPYGALYWWPCKQTLLDKIDSLDIIISTDTNMVAGSNGILIHEKIINDTTRIFHWKHRYPIANYLVAFAVTNYKRYTDVVNFYNKPNKLNIENYVFPQDYNDAVVGTKNTIGMMRLYDSLFGTYPFINEKYGHAQFLWGGGMEHQTMSFMVNFSFNLVAHELAHQWFGDQVTCGSWSDLWLNEGFATYLNALCHKYLGKKSDYFAQVRWMRQASYGEPNGAVVDFDTSNVSVLFKGDLRYNKAGFVVNMLRDKLGDKVFYDACKSYLTSTKHGYGFAKSREFKDYLANFSGLNLDTFFNKWVFGPGYPIVKIGWQQTGNKISINYNQTTSNQSISVFEHKLPLRFINTKLNKDTMVYFYCTKNNHIFNFTAKLDYDSVEFDPEVVVLAKYTVSGENLNLKLKKEVNLIPNPAIDYIEIKTLNHGLKKIEIFNSLGQKILEQNVQSLPKIAKVNLNNMKKGIYYVRISLENSQSLVKFVKL